MKDRDGYLDWMNKLKSHEVEHVQQSYNDLLNIYTGLGSRMQHVRSSPICRRSSAMPITLHNIPVPDNLMRANMDGHFPGHESIPEELWVIQQVAG